jgi:hypothetical protein
MNYDWSKLKDLGFSEESVNHVGSMDFSASRIKKYLNRDHKETPTSQMTPNYLPEEPGKGDEKNPEMGEGVPIRMPRMEVLKKAMNKNGQLAMRAEPNYSELLDFFESEEPNGAMAIGQLRGMREKIDVMLGMLYPDDNIEPWMAVKLTMSAQNLASVADDLRFGAES